MRASDPQNTLAWTSFHSPKSFTPLPPPPFSPTILAIFFSPKWNVENSVCFAIEIICFLATKILLVKWLMICTHLTLETYAGECAIATLQRCFRQISFVTLLSQTCYFISFRLCLNLYMTSLKNRHLWIKWCIKSWDGLCQC